MKTLLVTICVLFSISAIKADIIDTYLEFVKDPILTCAKENGFTEQTPHEIFEKDSKSGLDHATCLRSCVMNTMGTMKDSKIIVEKVNELVKKVHPNEPDRVAAMGKVAVDCMEKVKDMSDNCKMAYSYTECFLDKEINPTK